MFLTDFHQKCSFNNFLVFNYTHLFDPVKTSYSAKPAIKKPINKFIAELPVPKYRRSAGLAIYSFQLFNASQGMSGEKQVPEATNINGVGELTCTDFQRLLTATGP